MFDNLKFFTIMSKRILNQYIINNTSVMVDDEKPSTGKVLCRAQVRFLRGLVHITPLKEVGRVRYASVYKANEVLVMTRNSHDRLYMLRTHLSLADIATDEAIEDKLSELRDAMYAARRHYIQTHLNLGGNQNMEDRA